jgi:hypothetical protein
MLEASRAQTSEAHCAIPARKRRLILPKLERRNALVYCALRHFRFGPQREMLVIARTSQMDKPNGQAGDDGSLA